MALTHDKAILSLIRRLRNGTAYAIDLIDENCDCGWCGPCKKRRRLNALLKEADAVTKKQSKEAGVQNGEPKCPSCGTPGLKFPHPKPTHCSAECYMSSAVKESRKDRKKVK